MINKLKHQIKVRYSYWRYLLRTCLTTLNKIKQAWQEWINNNWLSIATCYFLFFLLTQKDVSIQLSLNTPFKIESTAKKNIAKANLLETSFSTIGSTTASKKKKKKLSKKEIQQKEYIKRYTKLAQQEMKKYGIPASIKLAQGLLESNAGLSPLATKNNNHFGIKCFSKKCKKGHCSNFNDDSHKDFFRVYQNTWESYRAHSIFLSKSKRYQKLFKLSPNNYKEWAKGLKKAGYATDPNYAKKLIKLIEQFNLLKYDVM